METVDDVRAALAAHDYLADEGLATAIFLAVRLQRPLLLEGEAGVGKTEVAKVLARWTGGELVRLQCYEGIDASQAVYEWDYARQLLHLRAVEAGGGEVVEDELYSERFLVKRPLMRAIAYEADALGAVAPPVLLVDEVDRADDEFAERLVKKYVIKRRGLPSDIAAMCTFLASPQAEWITGQTYPVNGGYSFSL